MSSPVRRVLALVCAVLACLSIVASVGAVWANRNVLDADRWASIAGEVAADPDVQAAVSRELTDAVFQLLDLEQRTSSALGSLGQLGGPITDTAQRYATQGVEALVASDKFQSVWVEANRIVNQAAVEATQKGTGIVLLEDGQVVVNLLPLIPAAFEQVQAVAPSVLKPFVPTVTLTPGSTSEEQAAQLGQQLGVDLPDGFGQIELTDSNSLAISQDVVRAVQRGAAVWPVLAVAFLALGIWAAPRRRRLVVVVGIGTATAMVATWFAYAALVRQVLDQVEDQGNRDAVAAVFRIVTVDLRRDAFVVFVLGVGVALVAWLAGRPWSRGDTRAARAAGIVPAWVDALEAVVPVAVAAVLLVVRPSWGVFALAVAIVVLVELGLGVVGRAGSTRSDVIEAA